MPITWQQEADNSLTFTITGKLDYEDLNNTRLDVKSILESQKKVSILIVVRDFEGWEPSERWEDVSTIDEYDEYLSRFAIVGDEKWRDRLLAFTLDKVRSVDIRYFTSETEARNWLSEE